MATPDEYNLLNQVQFKLDIHGLPNVTYFMQTAIVPSVQFDSPRQPTARGSVPVPGSQYAFDPLIVTFLVDENLNNYIEIYKWFIQMATTEPVNTMFRDCTLHILSGQMNSQQRIIFVDAFPTMLSELSMSSGDNDLDRQEVTVSFAYKYFIIDGAEMTYNPGE